MNPSPKQYYDTHIAFYDTRIAVLRRRGRLFMTGEIAFFAIAIGFVALYTVSTTGLSPLAAALLSVVAYVVVRRMDERNDGRRARLEALREVCVRERDYLDGTFTAFDDGRRYADARHPFAFDIDVFGPQSLYHRICRTVTTGGSDRLATMLSAPQLDTIDARADAIAELATQTDWRKEYCAEGVAAKVDTAAVVRALHGVE